jgi:hypothetical protein
MKHFILFRIFFLFFMCIICFFSAASIPPCLGQNMPTKVTLGFDGLADLAANIDDFGAHFTGATVLACGGSLNCAQFPPFSGRNVIYDTIGLGGLITVTFDPSITGHVGDVSARVTGNRVITMTAYDRLGAMLGTTQTPGPNYVGSGLPPNILLSLHSDR